MVFLYCHYTSFKFDFLDSGSYILDGIISLHDHILFYSILILTLVIWTLLSVLINKTNYLLKDFYHGSLIEIIWTIIPGIILIMIALPSFRLLYLMDDFIDTSLSIKIIGKIAK